MSLTVSGSDQMFISKQPIKILLPEICNEWGKLFVNCEFDEQTRSDCFFKRRIFQEGITHDVRHLGKRSCRVFATGALLQ